MKIHPVGAVGTDEHDEANNHFSQFWKHAKKKCTVYQKKSLFALPKPTLIYSHTKDGTQGQREKRRSRKRRIIRWMSNFIRFFKLNKTPCYLPHSPLHEYNIQITLLQLPN